jgi:PST family polysaccharide transporter
VQLSAQGIQLVLTIASGATLARLLTPADFGVVGMAATLTAAAGVVRDFGMPLATIQREGIEERDVSALFWLGLRLNLVLVVVQVVLGPLVALFYDDARVTWVVAAFATSGLLTGLGAYHEALLVRQMRFTTLRAIDITSLATGMTTGVILALTGAGYRALVIQVLVTALLRTVALWRACHWRPGRPPHEAHDVSALTSFAWYHTGAKLLRHTSQHLQLVVVGYLFGARQLGLFESAYRWSITAVQQIYPPLQHVAIAGLSRLQWDSAAFRQAVRRGLLPVFSLIIPALALLVVEARPVILLLLGAQWEGTVPLFRLLCLAAIGNALVQAANWIYVAEGRTRQQMMWGVITLPVYVIAAVVGARWGPLGVASAFAIASLAVAIPEIVYCLHASHVRLWDYTTAAGRPLVASAVAAVAVWLLPPAERFPSLILASLLFAAVYAVVWMIIPGGRMAAQELMKLRRVVPSALGDWW